MNGSFFLFIDENNCQPEITPALYIKTFRQKEKVDVKYVNTYLEDPEFIAFQERASKPDSVLVCYMRLLSLSFASFTLFPLRIHLLYSIVFMYNHRHY